MYKNWSSLRTSSFRVNWRCKLTCLIENAERCTKQFVQSAAKNAKFHSSLAEAGLYTVENVLLNEEDTNITS